MKNITLEQARKVVDAAIQKSNELGVKMNIAVVDAGTNLVAFNKMDDAWLGSIGQLSQPGGSLYNIEHSNGGLITFPGGVVIKDETGAIIGAVGVSGSTVEDDHAVASAGAKAIN